MKQGKHNKISRNNSEKTRRDELRNADSLRKLPGYLYARVYPAVGYCDFPHVECRLGQNPMGV
jgi:hypothetical protein